MYSPSFSFCDQTIQQQPSLSSNPKTYITFGIVVNVIRPVSLSPCSRLPDFSLSEKEIALLSLSACPLYPLKTGVSNTNDGKKYDKVTGRVKNRAIYGKKLTVNSLSITSKRPSRANMRFWCANSTFDLGLVGAEAFSFPIKATYSSLVEDTV